MSTYTYKGFGGLLKLLRKIKEDIALCVEYEDDKYLFAVVGEDNNTLVTVSEKYPWKCADKIVDFLQKKYNIYDT